MEGRKKRRVGGKEGTKRIKWTWTLASKIPVYVNQLYLIKQTNKHLHVASYLLYPHSIVKR